MMLITIVRLKNGEKKLKNEEHKRNKRHVFQLYLLKRPNLYPPQ